MKTNRLVVLGLVSVMTFGSVFGCSAPDATAPEHHGSTSWALKKPKPAVKAKASKETTAKYGITEWRLFKGKGDVVMTGFDADGKAVKGMSVGFAPSKETGDPEVVTKIHDGSGATLKHSLVAQDAADQADVPADSAEFAKQVAGDLGGLQQALGGGDVAASLPPAVAYCGATLANLCAAAIQCCCGFLFGGWGAGGGGLAGAWGAANSAIQSGAQCAGAVAGGAAEIPGNIPNVDVGTDVGNAGAAENPLANGNAQALLADGEKLVTNPDTGEVDFADDTKE